MSLYGASGRSSSRSRAPAQPRTGLPAARRDVLQVRSTGSTEPAELGSNTGKSILTAITVSRQ